MSAQFVVMIKTVKAVQMDFIFMEIHAWYAIILAKHVMDQWILTVILAVKDTILYQLALIYARTPVQQDIILILTHHFVLVSLDYLLIYLFYLIECPVYCFDCLKYDICKICADGYYLQDGKCLTSDSSCKTCSNGNDDSCTACQDSYF